MVRRHSATSEAPVENFNVCFQQGWAFLVLQSLTPTTSSNTHALKFLSCPLQDMCGLSKDQKCPSLLYTECHLQRRSSSPRSIRRTPAAPNLESRCLGRQTLEVSHAQTSTWSTCWLPQNLPCWSRTSTERRYTPGHSVAWDLNIAVVSDKKAFKIIKPKMLTLTYRNESASVLQIPNITFNGLIKCRIYLHVCSVAVSCIDPWHNWHNRRPFHMESVLVAEVWLL